MNRIFIHLFRALLIPLFVCFLSTGAAQKKDNLKKEIEKIVHHKRATIAVSLNGIDFPFRYENQNAHKMLPMASVFKFHIALFVLDRVDNGSLSLKQNILVKKEDLREDTWSPLRDNFTEDDFEMPLSELLKFMIAYSDNNAADILIHTVGGTGAIQNFLNKRGITKLTIKATEEKMSQGDEFIYWNTTTTTAANQLLIDFYKNKIVSKSATAFLMRTMLETTTGKNKIRASLPEGTAVAHRTGSSGKDKKGMTIAENDIAIITLPNGKHYALSVFVADSMESEETNIRMIAEISRVVWELLASE